MNEIITIQVVKDNEAYTIGEYTVLQYANKVLVSGGNSEVCMEMGLF